MSRLITVYTKNINSSSVKIMLPKLKRSIFFKENNLDTAIWQPTKGGDVGEKNPGSLEGENDSRI